MPLSAGIYDAESVLVLPCNSWQHRSHVAVTKLSHIIGNRWRVASYLPRSVLVQASDRYSCPSIQYGGD